MRGRVRMQLKLYSGQQRFFFRRSVGLNLGLNKNTGVFASVSSVEWCSAISRSNQLSHLVLERHTRLEALSLCGVLRSRTQQYTQSGRDS